MNINNNISYFLSANDTIDIVLLSKVNKKYPLHTHAEHYTIGIVADGKIAIETAQDQYICEADDIFFLLCMLELQIMVKVYTKTIAKEKAYEN